MDTVALFKKSQKKTQAAVTQITRPEVAVYDPRKWADMVVKILEAYPDLTPDFEAVEKGGKAATGEPVKYAVLKRNKSAAEGLKAANVTLYSSGKAVYTNLAAVAL